jgi:hypothetical protein
LPLKASAFEEALMITLTDLDQNIVLLEMRGKVTARDYRDIRPKLDGLFSREGKERFIIDLSRLNWLSIGAILEDLRLDLRSFRFIGTTAVVTHSRLMQIFVNVIDKIYPEQIRAFTDRNDALTWLHGHYTNYGKGENDEESIEGDIL